MEEIAPEDKCEIDKTCDGKANWWLIDQEENIKFKACEGHKDRYLTGRFRAEKRILGSELSEKIGQLKMKELQ